MNLIFTTYFDGMLDIREGDSLEVRVLGKVDDLFDDMFKVAIVRQLAGRQSPPALGVNVNDGVGLDERLS